MKTTVSARTLTPGKEDKQFFLLTTSVCPRSSVFQYWGKAGVRMTMLILNKYQGIQDVPELVELQIKCAL
jgi:hypothetical protein